MLQSGPGFMLKALMVVFFADICLLFHIINELKNFIITTEIKDSVRLRKSKALFLNKIFHIVQDRGSYFRQAISNLIFHPFNPSVYLRGPWVFDIAVEYFWEKAYFHSKKFLVLFGFKRS